MGATRSLLLLGAGAIMGGAAVIAYRISEETGKPFQEALSEVPAELERLYAELRAKSEQALEKGRALYEEKQAELEDQLREFTSAH